MSQVERMKERWCWDERLEPWPGLIEEISHGAYCECGGDKKSIDSVTRELRRDDVKKPAVFVGTGTCGLGAGSAKTVEAVKAWLKERKIDADVHGVGCIGLCSEEPIMDVQLPGKHRLSFGNVTEERVPEILESLIEKNNVDPEEVLGQFNFGSGEAWPEVPSLEDHSFFAPQKRFVLALSGLIDPTSIDEYIARGGYSALAKTLRERTPDEVIDEVIESGLRGRGGGGFPTGRKWRFARNSESEQKYLICNADEGDPGAFMDRAVAESDPHRLIEGMILSAYAIGASKAYIYIRAEYPLGIERLVQAIEQATRYGFLGDNILGSGFSLGIKIKMGAGAFVCGEETALMHSIEGKRGMPRPRPPYPTDSGLFGKATIINNVETLANIPGILLYGGEAFSTLGTSGSNGTKVFAVSGMVNRTGLVEIPMGTSLREIVFDIGGGVPGGRACKGVQIGGPSGGCIPEPHLDIATDYEELKKFGAIMGSGGLVILDEGTCMVDLAKFFMEFIQKESCGKCIPCREGTRRLLEILEAITRNRGQEGEIDALLRFQGVMHIEKLARVIKSSSLCGLGQTAPNPVLTTLKWFREEYEAHIFDRTCPAGTCTDLVGAPCQTGCPVGTEVWRYVAHISRGEFEDAYRVIRHANPFPSACARVCNHPCETVCRAATTGGEAVAVRTLKRFVVENVDPSVFRFAVAPAAEDADRVAVIGAGPAGLTAAHELSKKGHRVDVFEKESQPGGMLMCAIPSYRLPRATLVKEINLLLNDNIKLTCGRALGRDFTLSSLRKDGYKAVFVAVGSHENRKLGLEGEDAEGVLAGINLLKSYNLDGKNLARGRVGIIGGGNSAIDAARVAIRQDGVDSVTVYYRRTRAEMPAYEEEIEAALEEGIRIVELVAPVGLKVESGRLKGVTFQKNELGPVDSSGRRRPVPIQGSEFDVELDTLVVAISEQPETSELEELKLTKWGTLAVNPESLITGMEGVFGGGDAVSGPRTVIEAIADGKRAAMMIDRYLSGKKLKLLPKVILPSVYVEPMDEDGEGGEDRVHPPMVPIEERKGCFKEVELTLSSDSAMLEAKRCLRCDLHFTRPV